jgi:molybdopterin-guanine dinucleotide biosynthesis protein A
MDLDAFVLIGGRSRRLGRDKALVELGGITLAKRAAATLREALSPRSISFVAASKDQFAWDSLDNSLPLIFDVYSGKGATGALHAALSEAMTEWAAVLACDLPFVTTGLVQRLAAAVSDDVDVVIPVQPDGRFQPLCALYRVKECCKYLEHMLTDEDMPALSAITSCLRTRSITYEELRDLAGSEHFFLNVNTAEDLEKARQLCVSAV